jgi:hypothetical protein
MSTIPQDGSRPTVGKEDPMTDNALKPTAPAIPEATRWLALGAVAGPVLFTLAWFVAMGWPSAARSDLVTCLTQGAALRG